VAVLVNLIVAVVATLILRATKVTDGGDGTVPSDYTAEGEATEEPALAPEPIT